MAGAVAYAGGPDQVQLLCIDAYAMFLLLSKHSLATDSCTAFWSRGTCCQPKPPVHRLHALPEQDLKATVEQLLSSTQNAAAPSLLAAPAPERTQSSATAPAAQQLHLPELPPLPSTSDVVRSASAAWSVASSAFSQLQRMASSPGGHEDAAQSGLYQQVQRRCLLRSVLSSSP